MAVTVSGTSITFNDATVQTTAASAAFPTGTAMLFVQTAAPTGWTKSLTHNNKALRIVSGTAGSGGTAAFTTAFGTPAVTGSVSLSGSVGATTLTTAQIPSHTHTIAGWAGVCGGGVGSSNTTVGDNVRPTINTGATGGGGSHTHSFSGSGSLSAATAAINVQYVDTIIAIKD